MNNSPLSIGVVFFHTILESLATYLISCTMYVGRIRITWMYNFIITKKRIRNNSDEQTEIRPQPSSKRLSSESVGRFCSRIGFFFFTFFKFFWGDYTIMAIVRIQTPRKIVIGPPWRPSDTLRLAVLNIHRDHRPMYNY